MKLHVYAQQLNHDAAWLVGDKQALCELRDAVDRAIQDGNTCLDFETQDGEGYSLYIAGLETKDIAWEQLDLPYIDRSAMGFKDSRLPSPPWSLIAPERHKELRAKLLKNSEKTIKVDVPPSPGEHCIHVDIPAKTSKARVVKIDRTNTYEGPSLAEMREQDDAYEQVLEEMKLYLSFEPGWDGYHAPVFTEKTILSATNLVGKLAAAFRAAGDAPDKIIAGPCPDGRIDLEVIQGTKKVIFTIDDELEYIEATIFGSVPRVATEEEGISHF